MIDYLKNMGKRVDLRKWPEGKPVAEAERLNGQRGLYPCIACGEAIYGFNIWGENQYPGAVPSLMVVSLCDDCIAKMYRFSRGSQEYLLEKE